MSMPKLKPKCTVDQYLAMERGSAERNIYLDGDIYAMAGESDAHADISLNLAGIFYNQLRGKRCRARTKDTKVRSGDTPMLGRSTSGMFSYPDVVVICGEPEYHDANKEVVLNPTAIVEVLSTSTEAFDRGEKFTRYQTWNTTLTDYVLVSQDKPQIEHFVRDKDGTWSYRRYTGLESSLVIASIGCTLKLAEVYERVSFGATEGQRSDQ
jgi:Uma2 family endonuclease